MNVVFPLVLAGILVLPALKVPADGPLGWLRAQQARLVQGLMTISVQQNWRMYAPNPSRSNMGPHVVAVWDDGEEVPLEESERAAAETGRVWAWRRRRVDFWRFQIAAYRPNRPNRNRSWYLWGVCVREARGGETPRLVKLYGERVRLAAPADVAKGEPVLRPPERKRIATVACRVGRTKTMIEEDRGGRR